MLAFYALYNVFYPYNFLNFIHHLFKYVVNWHRRVFDGRAWGNHNTDIDFRNNWLNYENRRYYEEKVYNHFTIQFGFVLLLQLFFLFFFLIVKLVYGMMAKKMNPTTFNQLTVAQKQKATKSHGFWRRINDLFDQRFLYSVWMFFIVEAVAFIIYNFKRESWHMVTSLFKWSLALAIIYFIVYIALLVWNFLVGSKGDAQRDASTFNRRWGFIYEGLERGFLQRIFQFVQYLIYFLWALFLTALYPSGNAQGILHLILILLLFIYVLVFRPARSQFWKMEQIGIHFFLLLTQILVLTLVFDDHYRHMSGMSRWRMGYAVAFFIFFIYFWNMCVLLYKLFEFWTKCKAARIGGVGTGLGGMGGLHADHDYEQTGTKYVKNDQGDYELIERMDVKEVRDSNQDNVRFFDSNLDRQMNTHYTHNVMGTQNYTPGTQNIVRTQNYTNGTQYVRDGVISHTTHNVVNAPR